MYDLFALKYTVLPHLFAVINCFLYKQHWSIYRSFCSLKAKKAGNTEQDSYQPPFYCNFDFRCLVSAHAQTLTEYPDTKKQIRMFSSRIIYPDNRISVPALYYIGYIEGVALFRCVMSGKRMIGHSQETKHL